MSDKSLQKIKNVIMTFPNLSDDSLLPCYAKCYTFLDNSVSLVLTKTPFGDIFNTEKAQGATEHEIMNLNITRVSIVLQFLAMIEMCLDKVQQYK